MTNPTDPRIEAAAREMCLSTVEGDERIWNEMSERDKGFYRRRCALILRAADEAAWLPIESAPKSKDAYIDIWTNFYGGERYTDCSFRDGYWMIWIKDGFGDGEYERVPGIVTHWRPQPEGPKS